MKYHELLSRYIEESKLSLGELVLRLKNRDIDITKSYISKLKNGNKPPASEEITRALAEVTGGDPDALVMAAYIDKAPTEVKDALREAEKYRFAFHLTRKLMDFMEFYNEHQEIQEDLLHEIQSMGDELREAYHYDYPFDKLKEAPESALQLIGSLRSRFFPQSPSVTMGSETIHFANYLDDKGQIVRPFPRTENAASPSYNKAADSGNDPDVTRRMLEAARDLMKETDDYIDFLENMGVEAEYVEDILKDVIYMKRYMNKLYNNIHGLQHTLQEGKRPGKSTRNPIGALGIVTEESGEYLSQAAYNGKPAPLTEQERKEFEAKRKLFEKFNGEH
ncbi:hypothetical protein [Paenibacillus sp. 32352]|uniref:hypothetical protein n=1 Tax=Paenibacillus sp. 32352 TaxID=1969111 RepID=UPI0009ABDB87|nr:hypothetical protein [Paenibacillus sp. 32352]